MVLCIIFCILINFLGKIAAAKLNLPIWADCFGTVFAAYLYGPVWGGVTGAFCNLLYGITNPVSIIYGITNISMGVCAGIMTRKNSMQDLFHAMSMAGLMTFIAAVISTPISLILYDGYSGNIWGDGVMDFLISKRIPVVIASFVGEYYLDFADKVMTVLILYGCIYLYRRYISKKPMKRDTPDQGAVKALGFVLIISVLSIAGKESAYAGQTKENKEGDISYIQTVYNSENGLSCGNANDLAQTDDGILWVGTYAGLFRYNGREFRLMNEYENIRNVNCLYVDSDDRIWAGTNDNGLVVIEDGTIVASIDSSSGLDSDSVRSIAAAQNGKIYAGTSAGMCLLSFENNRISLIKTFKDINYAFCTDTFGEYVACVTLDAYLKIIKDEEVITSLKLDAEEDTITAVAFNAGKLYVGTAKGKIIIYDHDDGKLTEIKKIECEGTSNINRICAKDNGALYICADSGIGYLDNDDKYNTVKTGTFSRSIMNMLTDYQNNMWFTSTRHGLLKMSVSPFKDVYSDVGLEEKVVNSTCLYNGNVYSGTDSGLDIIDMDNKTYIVNDLTKELEGVRVRCIKADSMGNLWICSYGKGLVRIDSSGNEIYFNSPDDGVGSRVRVCYEMEDGTIAVGSDVGLGFIKGDRIISFIPFSDELGFAQILCMWQLSDGSLLVGTDGNGIVTVKDMKPVSTLSKDGGLSSGVILRMVPDKDGDNIFVITSNSLSYLDENGPRILSNFPYNNNYDIYTDKDGELFVLGSAGCYVVKRDELLSNEKIDFRILNSKLGLAGALTANAWNGTDGDNNIYLSTEKGIFMVNADNYIPDSEVYKIIISSVSMDGNETVIRKQDKISVVKDVNKIEIFPEIVNYTREDPIVYYYLEGMDEDRRTVQLSELSSVVYTNVPSGNYVFHIGVVSGITGKDIVELRFGIEKERAFYDNTFFSVYMILVGALFIFWVSWYFSRKRLQRILELSQSKLELALKQVQIGNETIIAIAKTVDAKDSLTSRHSQRVSEYSALLAKELGFSDEEIENLRKAALMHDIGKIGIPDSILNKPGRLTDEEYAIMKTHVTKGAEILKDFTLIEHVVEGAKYHHEKYDGTGYPEGLKGEEIPLYGRIIAVADAFDAMTANRVYRKKLDFEKVLSELRRCRGTQFDPEFIDAFLKVIDEGKIDIRSLYDDSVK